MTSIAAGLLGGRVYELVRDRILTGRLPAGDPIRQDALASELGISKIPLREALMRLEQEGLVSSRRNRGFVVAILSAEEAEEVFALRLTLEPDAVLRGSAHATADDRAAAETALRSVEHDVMTASHDQGTSNRLFHMALVSPGAGRTTVSLIERLSVVAERYVRLHLAPPGRDGRAVAEHREIFASWAGRDARRLERLAWSHIQTTLNDLRRELRPRADRSDGVVAFRPRSEEGSAGA